MVDEPEAPSKIDFKAFIAKQKDPNFPKEDEDQFTPFAKMLEELGCNLPPLDLDELTTPSKEKNILFTDEQRKLLQAFYHNAFSEETHEHTDIWLLQKLIWAFQQYCEFEEEMKIDDNKLYFWIGSCASMGLNVLIRDVLTERNKREPKFDLNHVIGNLDPIIHDAVRNPITYDTLLTFGANENVYSLPDYKGRNSYTAAQLAGRARMTTFSPTSIDKTSSSSPLTTAIPPYSQRDPKL